MAEKGKDVEKKGVQDLEKEITCAICHEHYTEPKVLPCCHYYCKQCIHNLALRTGTDKPFPCPECRKDTTLPEASVDNLPTAFFVNRMKEVHSKLELAHGKVEAKCEMCLEDKAEAFCRQCTKFICADCVKAHQRLKTLFPGHKISTLNELKEGGAKEILIQEPSHESCKVHDQPKNIFCYDCDILICRDCTIKDHLGHNYEFIKVAGPEAKKMLIQQLEPLRKSQRSLSCAIKEIQTTLAEVEDQGGSVANTIKCSCAELHAIIDNHQESLLTEAATRVQQKVKHLSGQEKSLSTAYASVQSVIEYTEQYLEHSPNDKVVCMRVEMQSRIDREIQEQQKEGENLAPVEEVDMGVEVSCAEDLKQLCLTKAKIMQLPIEALITGEGIESAEVSKMSEFRVVTALSNGKPTKQPGVIECRLHSLAKDSTTKCTVNLIQGGEYCVQYTPTVRGRHEVILTINGKEVAGSPFPVFVSIHPAQLGKPVQVITGVDYPYDVDLTPAGNIIVAISNKVAIFNKNGKKLKELKGSEFGFGDPTGVAIDSTDGSMYITSDYNIVKLSPDFKQEQVVNTSGSHYRIVIVGDEVMVCNYGDGVMVYTKELKYVRKIGSYGDGPGQFGDIWGVSSDEHGNLYVSDNDKSCVHVFSNGEFLHSFGCGEDGEKVLSDPRGVCVAGQYVYVANYGKHCVSVFTTKGEHVTTFGQGGSGDGDFNGSVGVCADKDGFVCVCDYNNNRVQIF